MGDVHGCRDELAELLGKFGPARGDVVAAVGDLVNKGPDSAGVLDLVRSEGMRCVLGNHDAKLLRVAQVPLSDLDEKSLRFTRSIGPRIHELAEEIRAWPLWLDLDGLLVVHAGLEPGKSRLEQMSPAILITIRTWDGIGRCLDRPEDPPWYECMRWPVPVVFGHWAMRGLVDRPDVKGLDTGCVYGGRLTGWCPEEQRFYHVQARRQYVPMERD